MTSSIPVAVDGGLTFKEITAGARHVCALTSAGAAFCWGSNAFGQLGRDTPADTAVPVPGSHTFVAITAGENHTCGIASDGLAWCWGDDSFGQLGDGDQPPRANNAPVAVAGNYHFTTIDAGRNHTCAIETNGDAYCWGAGAWGRLGNGMRSDEHSPVRVNGTHQYAAISLGEDHSCGLDTDGALFCWGSHLNQQLAATPTEKCLTGPNPDDFFYCPSTPVPAAAAHRFVRLSAGGYHTCALESNGRAFCWGSNTLGQVGNGQVGGNVVTPVQVPDPPRP